MAAAVGRRSERSATMEPMSQTSIRSHQESVTVQASAGTIYDLGSDITRTGEWSSVCTLCWWDDEDNAGTVGAWFTGCNELAQRSWETRSQVVAAERGHEFTPGWLVAASSAGDIACPLRFPGRF